jgi:Putative peptidoglycan binding domain
VRKAASASVLETWPERLRSLYSALVRVRLPRIFGLVLRNPRDSACAVALMLAVTAIVANGLYLQPGRHPAPIFAIRPPPVIADAPATIGQRRSDASRPEPTSRNEPASKTDSVPMPRPRAQSAPAAARADVASRVDAAAPSPAEAASPSWQVSAVQRTLNQAGYGPIRVSGILDDSTREGIARFERDHNLPITGQNTPRVRHALSVATGRLLD